jgi:hypothetical protein
VYRARILRPVVSRARILRHLCVCPSTYVQYVCGNSLTYLLSFLLASRTRIVKLYIGRVEATNTTHVLSLSNTQKRGLCICNTDVGEASM